VRRLRARRNADTDRAGLGYSRKATISPRCPAPTASPVEEEIAADYAGLSAKQIAQLNNFTRLQASVTKSETWP